MDLTKHIVIINGINKTCQVETIRFQDYRYTIKFHNSDKTYFYSWDKVTWLTNPIDLDLSGTHVFIHGSRQRDVQSIRLFAGSAEKYYTVISDNGFIRQYASHEIDIRVSCLTSDTLNLLDYFKQCAAVNTLGIADNDARDTQGFLSGIYSRIDFIDGTTAAATYLNPSKGIRTHSIGSVIFPFGCNASQERAVKTALSNQLSVIQGPPGTGKTQTILNIIANLLVSGKSVLVVSSNNSATENVAEKLARNGFGFLVAPLGNSDNRKAFIASQPPLNPDLPSWDRSRAEISTLSREVGEQTRSIEAVFDMREQLAAFRQELAEVQTEQLHFQKEHSLDSSGPTTPVKSGAILRTLSRLNDFALLSGYDDTGFWHRVKTSARRLELLARLRYQLRIPATLIPEAMPELLTRLESMFYTYRIAELESGIASLETALAGIDAKALMDSLTEKTMTILKASLSDRFNRPRTAVGSIKELYDNGPAILRDYPVVLSTTFSSRSCFDSDTIFDYVIMDEASQVSVETGLLSLTCARNAVIVGDTMQLSNVVADEDRARLKEIADTAGVPSAYDASRHNFLESILAALPSVPQTLLREHYRCHPDIINFCNQKFYGGRLLIMTRRAEEESPLMVITTSEGHHSRGHYNQREIDTVKLELLPLLGNLSDTGVITPYKDQAQAFRDQLPGIEAATVHKYQGREKGTIIMSVTDDVITEFSDKPDLLNVAVSRAKDRFCLVVSGNPQTLKGNIHDLVEYIRYQRGIILRSKLHSIYDYLFSHINDHRNRLQQQTSGAVSQHTSENLTFGLIEKIRRTVPALSHIKTLCHYPLRNLLGDTSDLTAAEISYAHHPLTHVDFLIINRVSKEPLLAIETDGYNFHNETSPQFRRDRMKDHILESAGLPLLRLSTVGHSEEERILDALLGN